MNLCDIEKCTGCGACVNICPKKAIAMAETDTGKTVWFIDETQCVECGMCEKTCPVLNSSDFYEPVKTLAAWTLNEHDKKTCASGGIATALYRLILEENGVIYGCEYDDDLKPVISRSESIKDIEAFKSSKYVQSSTEGSFQQVKKDLADNRKVLYVGTPCQIDGLIHFLGGSQDNLVTVDIICHGAPPFKYLQDYVKALKVKKKPTSVTFRGKYDYCFGLFDGEERILLNKAADDYYLKAFLNGTSFRDNCYQCRYAGKDRVSDLTIGDFWGLDKKSLNQKYEGKISLILVNTTNGQKLIDRAQDYLYTEERSLEEARKHNEQLNHPMAAHEDRDAFLKNYRQGVYRALKSTNGGKEITKNRLKGRVKKLIKRK